MSKLEVKKANPLYYEGVMNYFKLLQGRILTIIDSVMPESNQLKATKDLIRREFTQSLNKIWDAAFSDDISKDMAMPENDIN